MTNDPMDILFGTLRAMIHSGSVGTPELLALLERASSMDHERYTFQWMPYLGGHIDDVLEATSLEQLESMGRLLPDRILRAFTYSGGVSTGDPLVGVVSALGGGALHSIRSFDESASDLCLADDEGLIRLTKLENSSSLRALELPGSLISDEGLEALARAPHVRRLETLCLRGTRVTTRGLIALAKSPVAQTLEVLDVQRTAITDEGVRAMTRSRRLGSLTSLNLESTAITDDSSYVFIGARGLRCLKHLHISAYVPGMRRPRGALQQDALERIAASPDLPELDRDAFWRRVSVYRERAGVPF